MAVAGDEADQDDGEGPHPGGGGDEAGQAVEQGLDQTDREDLEADEKAGEKSHGQPRPEPGEEGRGDLQPGNQDEDQQGDRPQALPGGSEPPLFGQTLLSFLLVLATIITARGRPWVSFFLVAATLALSAVFNYLLVPDHGIRGAAVATTLAAGLGTAGAGLIVFRLFGALFPPVPTLKIITASALLFALARWWSPSGWLLPPALALLSALYLLILFLLREIRAGDGKMFLALFKKPPPA